MMDSGPCRTEMFGTKGKPRLHPCPPSFVSSVRTCMGGGAPAEEETAEGVPRRRRRTTISAIKPPSTIHHHPSLRQSCFEQLAQDHPLGSFNSHSLMYHLQAPSPYPPAQHVPRRPFPPRKLIDHSRHTYLQRIPAKGILLLYHRKGSVPGACTDRCCTCFSFGLARVAE